MYQDEFEQIKEFILEGEYFSAHKTFETALETEHHSAYDEGSDDALYRLDELIADDIKGGYADDFVEDRARTIGMEFPLPNNEKQQDLLQDIHSVAHPTGPYYWTFCAKCN